MNKKLLSDLDLGVPGDLRSNLRGHHIRAEVLPEGLDVLLGVLGGHVDGVWRAKRAAGGCSEQSELTAGGLAVAAEGSELRVFQYFIVLRPKKSSLDQAGFLASKFC